MKRLLIWVAFIGFCICTAMGTLSLLASAKAALSRLETRAITLVIERTGVRISDVVSLPRLDLIDPNQRGGHVPDFVFTSGSLNTSSSHFGLVSTSGAVLTL